MRTVKIDTSKIYVNETWVTNGHVMVKRKYADKLKGKPFSRYNLPGVYFGRDLSPAATWSDIEHVVPKQKGAVELKLTRHARILNPHTCEEFAIALKRKNDADDMLYTFVNANFAGILLALDGPDHAELRTKPVTVYKGARVFSVVECYTADAANELFALVMPLRQDASDYAPFTAVSEEGKRNG